MKLVSVFDADNSLLRETVEGSFSLSIAQTLFMKTLDAAVQHQAAKVLLDGRTVAGEPATIERFYYSSFVADAVNDLHNRGILQAPQFAYVLIEPVLDRYRFGETVAVNRGMHFKVFDNMGAAEQWLGVALSKQGKTI